VADKTVVERIDSALTRIEAGAKTLRERRAVAERRFAMLEAASSQTLAALDALITSGITSGIASEVVPGITPEIVAESGHVATGPA